VIKKFEMYQLIMELGTFADYIRCGDIHDQIKRELKDHLDKCTEISTRDIVKFIKSKIPEGVVSAFPIGVCIDNVVAHWTPLDSDEDRIFKPDTSIIKIDFGIHNQKTGTIIDSAFSYTRSSVLTRLIEINREANECALKLIGPDALLSEIGTSIEEVVTSYDGYKVVSTVCGHQISPFKIHGDKAFPHVNIEKKFGIKYNVRMAPGEVYALEPFVTTGSGKAREEGKCSHYMLNYKGDGGTKSLRSTEKKAYDEVVKVAGTLAFTPDMISKQSARYLQTLVNKSLLNQYPPLIEKEGSHCSQIEQNIGITPAGKVVFTKSL
jgi:methionyl aminopeptidase